MLSRKLFWIRLSAHIAASLLLIHFLTFCTSIQQPPAYHVGYIEEGIASWYGPGFHGNPTANGDRFDMYKLTAAHRTLPFGTLVRVQNLETNRMVTVRINDRGPFIRGRIIDLSYEAARALNMISNGTGQVRITVLKFSEADDHNGPFWVQVGSFSDFNQAAAFRNQLRRNYPQVRLVPVELSTGKWYRVQVGKYSTENHATEIANQLEAEWGVSPLLVVE